jgi:hypothetical protein
MALLCGNSRAKQLISPIHKYLGGAIKGEMVELNAAYHQLITNMFRELAPYGTKVERTIEGTKILITKVYEKYPIWPFKK